MPTIYVYIRIYIHTVYVFFCLFELDIDNNSLYFKGKSWVPLGEYPRYTHIYHLYMGYIVGNMG